LNPAREETMRMGFGSERKRDREMAKREWREEKLRRKSERQLIKSADDDPATDVNSRSKLLNF
jgi:hypothetical protein